MYGMTCDGVTCNRLKAKKPAKGSRYADGQKRCQVCEKFIYSTAIMCPCCNTRLRGKPRKMVYKDGYNAQVSAQGGVIEHTINYNTIGGKSIGST